MAATRGVHTFIRNTGCLANFKTKGGLLKCSTAQLLTTFRQNGSCAALNLTPKTRQLLNTITKNNKWNKSVFDSLTRSSSSSLLCLLTPGPLTTLATLCSSSDELSSDGDEDSTNRKKRIYIFELLNDDP